MRAQPCSPHDQDNFSIIVESPSKDETDHEMPEVYVFPSTTGCAGNTKRKNKVRGITSCPRYSLSKDLDQAYWEGISWSTKLNWGWGGKSIGPLLNTSSTGRRLA